MVVDFTCDGCGVTVHLMPSVKRFVCGCNTRDGIRLRSESLPASHWLPLHRYSADHRLNWTDSAAREYYQQWHNGIPGIGCRSCTAKWDAYTVANPPDFTSAEAFFAWGVHAHNHVSVHHVRPPKPAMTLAGARLAYWPKPRGYCDPYCVAVTSLAPRDCPRQTAALDSWIDFGLTIHCVNTAAEIETLRPLYPQVGHWHPCEDQVNGLSKKTTKIKSLTNVSLALDKAVLLINSDCEVYGNPQVLTSRMADNTLVMGIRHNYSTTRKDSKQEAWGLDAFVITPEMAESLPNLDFGIGIPVWDYWIPFHFQKEGYDIVVPSEPWLFHKTHPLGWNQDDWIAGAEVLRAHYGYSMHERCVEFRQTLPFPPETT